MGVQGLVGDDRAQGMGDDDAWPVPADPLGDRLPGRCALRGVFRPQVRGDLREQHAQEDSQRPLRQIEPARHPRRQRPQRHCGMPLRHLVRDTQLPRPGREHLLGERVAQEVAVRLSLGRRGGEEPIRVVGEVQIEPVRGNVEARGQRSGPGGRLQRAELFPAGAGDTGTEAVADAVHGDDPQRWTTGGGH